MDPDAKKANTKMEEEGITDKEAAQKASQLDKRIKIMRSAFSNLDDAESTCGAGSGASGMESVEEFLKRYLEID